MTRIRWFMPVLVSAAIVLSPMTSRAVDQPTVAERFRAMFIEKAAAAGIDSQTVFGAPVKVAGYRADGSTWTETRPLGELLDLLAPDMKASVVAASGPFGTPEVLAGNTTHIFGTLYAGDSDGAACQEVSVARSQYAAVPLPNDVYPLPILPVTGAPLYLTPVPGALSPVIPESSWALPAYVVGGPVLHIKASYTLGLHTVGTLIGSAASTASGAPDPYPVWLPMVHATEFVEDHSIDFVGNVFAFIHGEFRFDLLGYTICGGFGALPLSDGAAIFDNHKILGVDAGFPDIP